MRSFKSIPLLGILLLIYIGASAVQVGILSQGVFDPHSIPITNVLLPSQTTWTIWLSDVIIISGLIFLFIEIVKSTGSSDTQIVEHILSMFVFILYMMAFLWMPSAANSSFFALMVMSLIDVIAGFTISITAARRDFSMG